MGDFVFVRVGIIDKLASITMFKEVHGSVAIIHGNTDYAIIYDNNCKCIELYNSALELVAYRDNQCCAWWNNDSNMSVRHVYKDKYVLLLRDPNFRDGGRV